MIIFLELGAWIWLILLSVAVYKFVESIKELRHPAHSAGRTPKRQRRRVPVRPLHLHLHRPRGAKA